VEQFNHELVLDKRM